MPIANSQQRDQLDKTLYQARNTTIASLVCSAVQLVSASASIAADAEPDVYVVNTASGSVTMTLPPLADVPVGRKLRFWKGSSASNSMIVDGYLSETIEGEANITRTARYDVVEVEKVQLTAGGAPTYGWMLHKAATSGTAAANRTALGIRQFVMVPRIDLVGATAAVYRYVHPTGAPTATLTRIMTSITGALTTGNAVITASIGGVAVTSGVVTITQAGSAAADIDSATPSAANTIAAGAILAFTVSGTNDAAVFADLSFELTY